MFLGFISYSPSATFIPLLFYQPFPPLEKNGGKVGYPPQFFEE